MRSRMAFIALSAALALAGCAQEKEWMKVGQPYTTEEFRRDYSDCTKGGKLDENCMRTRGWVSVTPGKAEKPKDPASDRYRGGSTVPRY